MSKTTATVYTGKTLQLTATVRPSNAVDAAVTWKSGDTSIATVSKKGLVTAKKPGTVTIRAMTAGGLKAYCKVTVTAVQVYQCVKAISIPRQLTVTFTTCRTKSRHKSDR